MPSAKLRWWELLKKYGLPGGAGGRLKQHAHRLYRNPTRNDGGATRRRPAEPRASSRGEFHHGECIGADAEAHEIAKDCGHHVVVHPPINDKQRAFTCGDEKRELLPYIDCNRAIVNETDALIPAPGEKEEQQRSGTWSTVRYARRVGRSIYMVFPDGMVKSGKD